MAMSKQKFYIEKLAYKQIEKTDNAILIYSELRKEIAEMRKQLFGMEKNITHGLEKVVSAVKTI